MTKRGGEILPFYFASKMLSGYFYVLHLLHTVLRTFWKLKCNSNGFNRKPSNPFHAMKRSDVKDLISGYLMAYGRGYSYDCELNGEYIDSVIELKSEAKEGDEVVVNVYTGHQKRWSRGHLYDRVRFKVEMDSEGERRINRYRNLNRSSIYTADNNDYQKSSLYRWERRFVDGFKAIQIEDKTESGAEKFLHPIFESRGLETPNVKFHSGRDTTCTYYPMKNEIRIGEWGYSKAVLVHEASHSVVNQLGIESFVSSHGPFFVSVYIELLSSHLGEDIEELMRGLNAWGVEFIENFSLERWVHYHKNEMKLDVPEINRIRQENNVLEDGTTLNDTQKETLKTVRNDAKRVDGRSARALINRNLVEKNDDSYSLTERGEDSLKNIRNEIV